MSERWRAQSVERIGGRLVAVVRDKQGQKGAAGELVRVYFRLGKWRLYRDDSPCRDRALAATARRAINGAERLEAGRPAVELERIDELERELEAEPMPAVEVIDHYGRKLGELGDRPQQLKTDGGAEAVEVDPPSGRHEQGPMFNMPEHSRGQLTLEG